MSNEIIDKIIIIIALIGILTIIGFLIPDTTSYITNQDETIKLGDKELLNKIGPINRPDAYYWISRNSNFRGIIYFQSNERFKYRWNYTF